MTKLEILKAECDWIDQNRHIAAAKTKYLRSVWGEWKGERSEYVFISDRAILHKRREYYDAVMAEDLWSMWYEQKNREFWLEKQL